MYAGRYQLFGPDKYLDFSLFIKEIKSKLAITFDKIYFYASYTPKKNRLTLKEKKYVVSEFTFYKGVKRLKKVIFFKGYRSKKSGKEKEVDVKLTADIVSCAFHFKTFIINFDTLKIKFHKKQKIEIIKLDKDKVRKLIKNPGVL